MKNILQGLRTLNLLEQNLKLRAQNHLQIVSNIANSPNPDYKAFEMVLDGALQSLAGNKPSVSMSITNQRHLTPAGSGSMDTEVDLRPQAIEIEEQMTRLVQNHLSYNASVEILSRKLRQLKLAMEGR